MKNLENFGVQELSTKEITNIQGGRNILEDWLIGKAVDIVWEFATTGWQEYGEWAYEHRNSSGGLKY